MNVPGKMERWDEGRLRFGEEHGPLPAPMEVV